MATITTIEQIDEIKNFIQTELLKRGFLAKITKIEESKGRYQSRIEFETEPFQTVPVLFRSIKVAIFNSTISEEKPSTENPDVIIRNIWISVHVEYDHFDGGSNGSKLFDFHAKISPKYPDKVFSMTVS